MRYYDLFDDLFNEMTSPSKNVQAMKCDIRELTNDYELCLELPGYKKENVSIDLKNGYLTIAVAAKEAKEGKMVRKERYNGALSRSFYVGEDMRPEDISARFDNGELFVIVPKSAPKREEEKRYITID